MRGSIYMVFEWMDHDLTGVCGICSVGAHMCLLHDLSATKWHALDPRLWYASLTALRDAYAVTRARRHFQ